MAAAKRPPRKAPPVTKEQALERYAVIERAIRQESYQVDEIESAIGMYTLGFHYGWKVLYIVHTKRTIAKYEGLLGIKIRDEFEEFGPDADRTNAYKLIQKVTNFWKLVSGDTKSPLPIKKSIVS